MEGIFLKLMEQLNSSVFTLLAILIIAFWGTYKVGVYVSQFSGFKLDVDTIKEQIRSLQNSMARVEATLELLYQAHLTTLKSKSPLSLTDKGTNISNALNFEEKISQNWTNLKQQIAKHNPTNPYDIQRLSMNLAHDFFNTTLTEQHRIQIKTHAYEIGIDIQEIIPIFGILIRDRFLKEQGQV